MNKAIALVLLAVFVAVLAIPAFAGEPKRNISYLKHANLAAAQDLVKQAYDKITAAQSANEFDMKGHAAKAKALLERAMAELKLAAEAANQHKK